MTKSAVNGAVEEGLVAVSLVEVVLATIVAAAAIGAVARGRFLARSSSTELLAFCGAHGVPATPDCLRLVERYLGRSVRYQAGWTWIGIACSIACTVSFLHPGPTLTIGLASYPPTSDLLLMALGGWFVGLVRCETYRLRRTPTTPRAASLVTRSVEDYAPRRLVVHTRVIALVSLLLVLLDALLPGPRLHLATVIGLGGCSLAVLLLAESCGRAIALRARPALAPDLLAADDAIRTVAARSLGYGASGLVSLLAGSQAWLVASAPPYVATPPVRMALGALGAALLLWALALALAARRELRPSGPRRPSRSWEVTAP